MSTIVVSYPWIVALAIVLALVAAFAYYYKDSKFDHVAKTWIYLLAAARALAVFLITMLLAQLLIKHVVYTKQKPIIVWLQDTSLSIKLANDSAKLAQFLQLRDKVLKQLDKDYQLEVFYFSKNPKSVAKPWHWPTFDGPLTNISSSIRQVKRRFFNQNLNAIILVSDGIFNQGFSPLQMPDINQFPIYTVILGDTNVYPDLKIAKLLHNRVAYLNTKFPVLVELQAVKAKGKSAELTLQMQGKTWAKKQVFFTSDNQVLQYKFYLKADTPGQKFIKVTVSSLDNERNIRNNTATSVINVVNNKQRILLLSNFPHPDIGAIRRCVRKNPAIELTYLQPNKFTGKLRDYTLVIFYQLPERGKSRPNLLEQVAKEQIPALFICGTKCDYFSLSQLLGKVQIRDYLTGRFEEGFPNLNQAFDLFVVPEQLQDLVPDFPPLIVPKARVIVNPDVKILFNYKGQKHSSEPLYFFIPSSTYNETKVGVILGEGIWRWSMSEFAKEQSSELFCRIITQTVQYLANKKYRQRFIVKVPQVINQTDDVIFTAQVFDRSYQATTKPDVTLELTDSSGHVFSYLFDKQINYYILNIGSLPSGRYKYKAQTKLGDEQFTVKGSFVVKPVSLESLDLQAKAEMMRRLAATTGGKYLQPSQIEQLPQLLENDPNIKYQAYSQMTIDELIANKWLLAVILLLLVFEWTVRKYLGNL